PARRHAFSARPHALSRNATQRARSRVHEAYSAYRQHMLPVPDVAGLSVSGRCGDSHLFEIVQSADAGVVFSNAGVVETHPANAPFRGMPCVVFAAIGAGHQHVATTGVSRCRAARGGAERASHPAPVSLVSSAGRGAGRASKTGKPHISAITA